MLEILKNPYYIVNVYSVNNAVSNIVVQTIPSGQNLITNPRGDKYRTNYSALKEFCNYINKKDKKELLIELREYVRVKPFDERILSFLSRFDDENCFNLYYGGMNCRDAVINFKNLLKSDLGKDFLFELQIKPREFLQIVQNECIQYQLSIIKKSSFINCLELESPRLGQQLSLQVKQYKEEKEMV